jgi:hypothetical protein
MAAKSLPMVLYAETCIDRMFNPLTGEKVDEPLTCEQIRLLFANRVGFRQDEIYVMPGEDGKFLVGCPLKYPVL